MHNKGFTLIELMVSVAIFSVVMTIALGALLSMSASEKKAETLKSVMNNLNFAIDSMSRAIRTGNTYTCVNLGSNCNTGSGDTEFSFVNSKGSTIDYKWEISDTTACGQKAGSVGCILRSVNGATALPITAPEVYVTHFAFYVVGQDPTDALQPKVTMSMSGQVQTSVTQKAQFNIQSSVTQRIYDK